MENIKELLKLRTDELKKRQTENNLLLRQIQDNEESIERSKTALTIGQEALQFLEDLANSRRGNMGDKIKEIITQALRLIYGPDYSVDMIYAVKNNRSFLDFEVIKKTKAGKVNRTMDGFGGGVADCISVPLRLLVLLGSKQTDRVCILDECYKHVNPERIELVSEFIKEITNKLDIQIIMCSHHEAMQEQANVVYEIADDNGKSVVRVF